MGFLNKLPVYYLCITITQQEHFIVGYRTCTCVKIQVHEVSLFVSESAILLIKYNYTFINKLLLTFIKVHV